MYSVLSAFSVMISSFFHSLSGKLIFIYLSYKYNSYPSWYLHCLVPVVWDFMTFLSGLLQSLLWWVNCLHMLCSQATQLLWGWVSLYPQGMGVPEIQFSLHLAQSVLCWWDRGLATMWRWSLLHWCDLLQKITGHSKPSGTLQMLIWKGYWCMFGWHVSNSWQQDLSKKSHKKELSEQVQQKPLAVFLYSWDLCR